MERKLLLVCAAGLLVALTGASAATHYVDASSTNAVPPFTNWTIAAVTIQDAVDGDEIVVTNGFYQTGARAVYGMSNRVAVTKPVTVRSVNGPESTMINGMQNVRCAYLTNGAVLSGFALTNGLAQITGDYLKNQSGGGVWCESQSAVVTNCLLAGNTSWLGVGGGAYSGTLNNCTFIGNFAGDGGGGAESSTLNDCVVTNNLTMEGRGGGAQRSTLNNCLVTGNTSWFKGGGGAAGGTLNNCKLSGNNASYGGGALGATLNNCMVTGNSVGGEDPTGGGADSCTLNNCVVINNSASAGGGAAFCSLNNCTVTGNSASDGGGAYGGTLNNCIIYFNIAANAPNCARDYYNPIMANYSCTTPDPGSGVGNITNAPLFVDTNGWSNLRLQSNSPCINAGNNAYVTGATDLNGLPRIAGGTVDIGAYEFQSPASTLSYAWLQQSGLPTDGSADDVDTDHDGHNNWQEWRAGTDPTNALSVLRLASPVLTPTNVTLIWTSVTNRTYTLEQATNLGGTPAFSVLRSNLAGLPGTTSWTDTNAPVSSPHFYQLRVSP